MKRSRKLEKYPKNPSARKKGCCLSTRKSLNYYLFLNLHRVSMSDYQFYTSQKSRSLSPFSANTTALLEFLLGEARKINVSERQDSALDVLLPLENLLGINNHNVGLSIEIIQNALGHTPESRSDRKISIQHENAGIMGKSWRFAHKNPITLGDFKKDAIELVIPPKINIEEAFAELQAASNAVVNLEQNLYRVEPLVREPQSGTAIPGAVLNFIKRTLHIGDDQRGRG